MTKGVFRSLGSRVSVDQHVWGHRNFRVTLEPFMKRKLNFSRFPIFEHRQDPEVPRERAPAERGGRTPCFSCTDVDSARFLRERRGDSAALMSTSSPLEIFPRAGRTDLVSPGGAWWAT